MVEVKMIIAVRKDVDLGKGKMAAQVAHAAVSCALKAEKDDKRVFKEWIRTGQKKIVVKIENLETIYKLKDMAERSGIATSLITDAGLTQIAPGTVTCLGLGPAEGDTLDQITGNFKLM